MPRVLPENLVPGTEYVFLNLSHYDPRQNPVIGPRRFLRLRDDNMVVEFSNGARLPHRSVHFYAVGDPDIQPASAELQASAVARARAAEESAARLWEGWTKGDAELYYSVFGTDAGVAGRPMSHNYAACPVCLKYTERVDGCNIVHHNCNDVKDNIFPVHIHEFYKTTAAGDIYWCIVCNRICHDHQHYEVGLMGEGKPGLRPAVNAYAVDCSAERVGGGGGGLYGGTGVQEKLIRFKALRDKAAELLPRVGTITELEAKYLLVEAMWDAPFTVDIDGIVPIEVSKNFGNANRFPAPARATANNKNAIYPDIPYTGQLPTVITGPGENAISLESVTPLFIFRHTADHEPVGLKSIFDVVSDKIKNFGLSTFGECIFGKTMCSALLHPAELEHILRNTPDGTPDKAKYLELTRAYKSLFNKRYNVEPTAAVAAAVGAAVGGAGGPGAFAPRKRSRRTKNRKNRKNRTRVRRR